MAVTVSFTPVSLPEDGPARFTATFRRDGDLSFPLTVNYRVSGTAAEGIDYTTRATKTVTFASGRATSTVVFDPLADGVFEPDEQIRVDIVDYEVGSPGFAVATITNDDPAPLPVISLAVSPASVTENGVANLVYTFTRTGATTNPLTVNYAIGGTATNGSDYTLIPASVTFAAGATTATVTVDPTGDAVAEADETVSLTLQTNAAYSIGTVGAVIGTISNDDIAPIDVAYLSDLTPSSASNGWGPYHRDRSNGEQGDSDGAPLTIRGVVYQKGLGVHAPSTIIYPLGGFCNRFRCVVGVDDEVPATASPGASITFRVLADGVEIANSGILTRTSPAMTLELPVIGVQALLLEVTGGDSNAWDHADWANAHLTFSTQAMLKEFLLFQSGRASGVTPVTPVDPGGGGGTPPENPSDPLLSLPRVPWWGGPAYYSQFSTAAAAGWTNPNFFPVGVFYGKPSHTAQLQDVGINVFMRAEYDGSTVASMTDLGMQLILQPEWTQAQVGSNPLVVGWHVSEEIDMGPGTPAQNLAVHMAEVNRRRAYNDGRFLMANFGNGVLGTFWGIGIMDDLIASTDVTTVDKYAYTSPDVRFEYNRSWAWTQGNPERAIAYGWQQDRMVTMGSELNGVPTGVQKPNWVFVETARPFLTEAGAETIALEEIEGAVWNTIIHGASGVAYFQHNNDATNGTYSLVTGDAPRRAKVASINAQIQSLAPVLNTQSYAWTFGANLQTSLKVHGGFVYIFAMTDGGSGSRTFTLPSGIAGTTVTVVDEARTIPVVSGAFTDTFAAEHEHHIYRIPLT